MVSSLRWSKFAEAIKHGVRTYNDLPMTAPTMDRKYFLLHAGVNDPQTTNDLMNTKVRWAFIDSNHTIQPVHSLMNTTQGYVAIIGNEIDSSQRVLLGPVDKVTACWISIANKESATQGNQQIIEDPSIEDFKAVGTGDNFVSPALLGMAEDGMDPNLVLVPKMFPIELGEKVPFDHNIKDPLPECNSYPTGFKEWVQAFQWAFSKNNKQPVTGATGGNFNLSNWERSLGETLSPGERVLSQAYGIDRESYILEILPLLPSNQLYKQTYVSVEMSSIQKMDEWNYQNPPPAHDAPQGQPAPQGIDINTMTNMGTVIATSVAKAMNDSKLKKTSISEKATTMLSLLGSYQTINDDGTAVLVPGEFTEEFLEILNTKNNQEAADAFQTHHTATTINLSNSSTLRLASMYMDSAAGTYNGPRMVMLKRFNFLNDNLNNVSLTYDTMITLFNYLRVNLDTNQSYKKMCRSERVAKADKEFEDDVQKRAPATRNLFVEGEQRTLRDLQALNANVLVEFHCMFKNPEEAVIYKMINAWLLVLHSEKGKKWMNNEINENKYYLHSMIVVLQNTFVSMISILCRDSSLIARVMKGEEITNPTSTREATKVGKMFLNDMQNESNMPAPTYKGKPKSYDFFQNGTQQTQSAINVDSDVETPPKRRKTDTSTETDTTTSTRDKSVSFSDDKEEKARKTGFLVADNQMGAVPRYNKTFDGKRICSGHIYIGQYCRKGNKCPCHHPDVVEQVPSSGRSDFIKWVNDKKTKAKFASGKHPKRRE